MKQAFEVAYINPFLSTHPPSGTMFWYESSQPAHPRLHQSVVSPVLEAGPLHRTLRPLLHSLRALKSSAEVALMQEAGRITAQVGVKKPRCQCSKSI